MSPDEQDRVVVVLVRARNPNNIGAVARAMHDFGYRHLRIVNDYAVPFESARSAIDASSVLAASKVCATVAEAVIDCTLVVGTTAVGDRDLQHPVYVLNDAAGRMRAHLLQEAGVPRQAGAAYLAPGEAAPAQAAPPRVALLFGSEKTGLSNDELSFCNWLTTIPMHPAGGQRHLSMNLGQAAAVCLYELSQPAREGIPMPALAAAGELERVTELLLEVLAMSGYSRRHPANSDPAQVRRLVRRVGIQAADAPVWLGVLRQLLWKMRAPAAKQE